MPCDDNEDESLTRFEIILPLSAVDLALNQMRDRREELLAGLSHTEGLHFADHLITLVEPPVLVHEALDHIRLLKRVLRSELSAEDAAEFDARIDEILLDQDAEVEL